MSEFSLFSLTFVVWTFWFSLAVWTSFKRGCLNHRLCAPSVLVRQFFVRRPLALVSTLQAWIFQVSRLSKETPGCVGGSSARRICLLILRVFCCFCFPWGRWGNMILTFFLLSEHLTLSLLWCFPHNTTPQFRVRILI